MFEPILPPPHSFTFVNKVTKTERNEGNRNESQVEYQRTQADSSIVYGCKGHGIARVCSQYVTFYINFGSIPTKEDSQIVLPPKCAFHKIEPG